jgi:hypothetical protein
LKSQVVFKGDVIFLIILMKEFKFSVDRPLQMLYF